MPTDPLPSQQPSTARASRFGLPRLGEPAAQFTARLGPAVSVRRHGQQLSTYRWGDRQLTVLFERGWAVALHCRYPVPQPAWVALADSTCFLPRGKPAQERGPRLERQARCWTLSSGCLSLAARNAVTGGA